MNDSEIKIALLTALHDKNIEEGRRLQRLRHELIDSQASEAHMLIDRAFLRFWGVDSKESA